MKKYVKPEVAAEVEKVLALLESVILLAALFVLISCPFSRMASM